MAEMLVSVYVFSPPVLIKEFFFFPLTYTEVIEDVPEVLVARTK